MPFRRTSIDSNQRTGFYSPKRSRVVGGSVYRFDSDALVYINAVEAADNQELEYSIKREYNEFVVGCKADNIWSAIKTSCIMVGANTISGALVPLVGVAPSGFNFTSSDYRRAVGLTGASGKYLDSNRLGNADPQNNHHLSTYLSDTVFGGALLATTSSTGASYMDNSAPFGGFRCRIRTSLGTNDTLFSPVLGFAGGSRTGASTGTIRANSADISITTTSQTPQNTSILVFARKNSSTFNPELFSLSTMSFYSIGESINLTLLDNRVTRLVNNIAFFINTGLDGNSYDVDTLKYVNAGYAAGGSLS